VIASHPRVALLLVTVGDLSGSGGTERHFASLFEHLRRQAPGRVTLITATSSLRRLQQAGLLQSTEGVVAMALGERPAVTKPGILWMTLRLAWQTLCRGYDILHICQPTPSYVPFAAVVTRLPKRWRPAVALTVVDCTLTPNLASGTAADLYERQVVDAHRKYFKWTRLDAIYSFYRVFVSFARSRQLLPPATTIEAAKYFFCDSRRFAPGAKERLVIFAGRFSEQKRPLLFVEAIAELLKREPQLSDGWRFEMYGRGPLGDRVAARIAELGVGDRITVAHAIDMAPIVARSRLLVSTQAHENFTSLATLEAMSAGNAIVAEDLGQSAEFVRPENGLLVTTATPAAFADAIARYMRDPGRHDAMAAASRRLATDVHTVEHSADDILAFWREARA
jgi:glycosyltransferase involved in cell wall biosynthesis